MTTRFESEIPILPRDIDINAHVHHSAYLDYFLAARFDQMERCYKMPMDEFLKMGYTWFARRYEIEFRSPLAFGDKALVRTWIEEAARMSVRVQFEIESKNTGRLAARGSAVFVLVDVKNNKPARLPEDVIRRYSI